MSYHVSMIYSYAKKIKDIRASPHNNCRPPGRGSAVAGRSRLEAGGGGSGGADSGKPPPVRGRGRG